MEVYKPSGYSYATVVKIPKTEVEKVNFDLCKQPRETIDAYYKRQTRKPDVIFNAGFFNMSNGDTVFTVINEKVVCSSLSGTEIGVGITGDNIVKLANVNSNTWRDFVSAYPPLVMDGKAYVTNQGSEINYKARRTVFGWNDTHYFVLCVDNPGIYFASLRSLCIKLGMKWAANLDGGGSTRLLVEGVRKTKLTANRPVDSVMCIYLKHEDKIVNYHACMTGATSLNVRKGPGTGYDVLGVIKSKTTVYHVIKENYDSSWCMIENLGWVSMKYMRKTNKTTSASLYKAKVTAGVLNVRSGPSTSYKVVSTRKRNQIVSVYEEVNGWGRIGGDQWCSLAYLSKI